MGALLQAPHVLLGLRIARNDLGYLLFEATRRTVEVAQVQSQIEHAVQAVQQRRRHLEIRAGGQIVRRGAPETGSGDALALETLAQDANDACWPFVARELDAQPLQAARALEIRGRPT